jgi:acyl carrier protein
MLGRPTLVGAPVERAAAGDLVTAALQTRRSGRRHTRREKAERRAHPSLSTQATMQLRSILVALALGASSAFMRPASVSRVTARFSVEDKLKEIVAEQLGVEQSSITPEASFASDLGADSLDVVEMVMKIEEEFNVELPDERAEEVQNLSDAVRVVTELTA